MLPSEIVALIIAIIFIVTGIILFFFPREMIVEHTAIRGKGINSPGGVERVSKTGSRIYGLIALCLGGGLAFASLYSVLEIKIHNHRNK